MKRSRLILLSTICVLALLLGTGCEERKPTPKPPKTSKRAKVAKIEKSTKPAKPVKDIAPGSIAYLDRHKGFRDVTLGDNVSNFSNLVLVSEDAARNLKTYTRSGDDLTLGNVPLRDVRYTFFEDRLCEVELRWKIEYPEAPFRTPPLSSIASYCMKLYGPPTAKHQSRKEQSSQHIWRGRKAEVILTELQLRGVPDVIKGSWSLPPTTVGQLVVMDIPLHRNAQAMAVRAGMRNANGL